MKKEIISMLKEFDYEKNDINTTIGFLVFILNELVNGGETNE